jgi:hypothetical protein
MEEGEDNIVLNDKYKLSNNIKERVIELIYILRFDGLPYSQIALKGGVGKSVIYKIQHREWFPNNPTMLGISKRLLSEISSKISVIPNNF